jgi:hypothetical protein
MTDLRNSGVGNLTAPRTDHTPTITKSRPNAIPGSAQPAITAMETEGVSGVDAGSQDQDTGAVPSNGALGAYAKTLVAPKSFHVP